VLGPEHAAGLLAGGRGALFVRDARNGLRVVRLRWPDGA
jgi:hypothetical protein